MIKKNIYSIVFAVIILTIMVLSFTNIINDTLGMSIAFFMFVIYSVIIAINARKNDVKLVEYVMIAFAIIGIILFIFTLRAYFRLNKDRKNDYSILVSENNSEKALLFNYDNHDYYTYNLTNDIKVQVNKTKEKHSLKDALESKIITLDDILNMSIPNDNTTGYKIYYDGGQKGNDKYALVLCENENSDIIFTTYDYTYDKSICE